MSRFSFVLSALTPLRALLLSILAIVPWTTPRPVLAVTFTSVQSGSWGAAATWDQGPAVPSDGDLVVISLGHTVTTDGNREPGDLTVNGTLDIRNNSLFFEGTTFTNNGALITTFCCGDFRFNGVAGAASTTQTLAGTGPYNSNPVVILNSTTVAPASGANLNGVSTLTINAGSTLSLANDFRIIGTTALNNNGTVSGAGTLKTQGTVTFSTSTLSQVWTVPLEVESGTTTGSGIIAAATIDTGATLAQTGLTVRGDLVVASGATFDLRNPTFNFEGTNLTNNGAILSTNAAGDLRFNGVGGANGTTQHGVSSTGTAAAQQAVQNGTTLVLDGSFPLGTLTIFSGTTLTSLASGTLTLSGNLTNNGTVLLNGSGGACGDAGKILIRSSVAGVQRDWGNGTYSIQDVDVMDQSSSSPRIALGSIDSGNNTNWSFPLCPGFYTVAPCRVLDTRTTAPSLSSGVPRSVPIVAGGCGIPATADAVVFNLTVANVPATGSLVAYPNAGSPPGTSTISFNAGLNRANNGVMALAADLSGTLQALATFPGGGTVDLIVDVSGYFVEP